MWLGFLLKVTGGWWYHYPTWSPHKAVLKGLFYFLNYCCSICTSYLSGAINFPQVPSDPWLLITSLFTVGNLCSFLV